MTERRERLRVEVENLHCEECATTLRESLHGCGGVELSQVDAERGCLRIEIDPDRITRDALRQQLREAGFAATAMEHIRDRDGGEPPSGAQTTSYGVLALALALLGAAGYTGYELYPRFDLPATEGAALLLLAAGAGIASFFSPCVFGLLVTLLAREAGAPGDRRGLAKPLRFAAGFSLGAAAFVLAVGAVIALGGAGLVAGVTFTSAAGRALRLAVGVLLVALGLVQLGLLPSPLHRVQEWVKPLQRLSARQRHTRPSWSYALFGFSYLLAGFG